MALASLAIFCFLIGYVCYIEKKNIGYFIKYCSLYVLISVLIPLPWFIFSYHNTGNPLYPLFSPLFTDVNSKVFDFGLLNPFHFIETFWNTFVAASDPISPLYIILLPLLLINIKSITSKEKIIYLYSLLALLFWYPISQVEGTRLLLPYLSGMSLLFAFILQKLSMSKQKNQIFLYKYLILLVLMTSIISTGYRFIANSKYIPVIIGQETKDRFLANHLNYSFGDFYDTDHYFEHNIKITDKVLLYGFHNLYYVNFPYIDSSWVQQGDTFNYIAVQNSPIPKRFANWKLVYTNTKTLVKLYKPAANACRDKCIY